MAKQFKSSVIKNGSHTFYDDVFRTLTNDCPRLTLPVINEVFSTNYIGEEEIIKAADEIFLKQKNGELNKKITDTSLLIKRKKELRPRRYHLECESKWDRTIVKRMYEYDAQLALRDYQTYAQGIEVNYPQSMIVQLRSTKNTPKIIPIRIKVPGGAADYRIPVLQLQSYTVEELFEKKLFFFLPYWIFLYEKDLEKIEGNIQELRRLTGRLLWIHNRLEECCRNKELDEYTKCTLWEMNRKVLRGMLSRKYPNILKEVEKIMGGNILEYEAKTILNKGIAEGEKRGEKRGKEVGLSAMVKTLEKILPDFETVYAAIIANRDYSRVSKSQVMKYYKQ